MSFDPKVYRNTKDGIGMPADDAATNTTQPWTLVSLIKGLINTLTVTGGTVIPAFTDDSQHTVGTTKTMPVAGTYRSTRDAVDDGDGGTLAMTAKRGVYVSPESPSGDSLVDDTNDRLNVGLIAAQNGVDGGAGTNSAKTLRTVTASDSPDITALALLSTQLTTINTSVAGVDTSVDAVTTVINTQGSRSEALDTSLSDILEVLQQIAESTDALGQVQIPRASATVIFTAAVSASRTIVPANMSRNGLMLVNTDANALLVKYGDTASATSYTVRIPYQGYWEMPRPIYRGKIDAIWEAVGSGGVMATEF